MRLSSRLQRGLLAATAALALAPAAQAVTTPMVLRDTVTELQLDWSWDASAGSYLGTHWNAWFTPSWDAVSGNWTVGVSYQHLDGPHGELAEATVHGLPALVVAPKEWNSVSGVDDHLPPTLHPLAHNWTFGAIGATQTQNGWAALDVTHPVPEPGTWLMLAGGLVALGLRGARRR